MRMQRRNAFLALGACWTLLGLTVAYLAHALASLPTVGQPLSQSYDFGTAKAGQVIEHVFEVTNPSARTLEITAVASTCGCMVPKDRPTCIPPRSARELTMVLTAPNRSGRTAQKAFVSFKDRPAITLTLRGEVIQDIPDRIVIPRLRAGQPHETQFYMRPLSRKHIEVEELEYDQRYFTVEYARDSEGMTFTVSLGKDIPVGPFQKPVIIRTNDEDGPTKRVLISGYILRWVEASPVRIALGILGPAEEKSAVVTLACPYGGDVSVTRIEAGGDGPCRWRTVERDLGQQEAKVEIIARGQPGVTEARPFFQEVHIYASAGGKAVRADVAASGMLVASSDADRPPQSVGQQ